MIVDLPLLKPLTCCSFLLEQPCRHWTRCRKRSYGTNISHYVIEIPAKLHQTAAILANMWPLRKSKMNHSLEPFGTNDPIEAKSSTSATAKKTHPYYPRHPFKRKKMMMMMMSFSQHVQEITLIYLSFFIIK